MNYAKKLVAIFLAIVCLTGCGNKETTNEGNESNNNTPAVTIKFSDAQNESSAYKEYEGKYVTITEVPVWKTEDDVTFGKFTFGVSCGNKDSLDLNSLEDGSEITLTGKLTYTSSLGFTIDNCTMS